MAWLDMDVESVVVLMYFMLGMVVSEKVAGNASETCLESLAVLH